MKPSVHEILASNLTAKKKAKALAEALSDGSLEPSAFLKVWSGLAPSDLATVTEAFEGATRKNPQLVDAELFALLIDGLAHEAPRVRWESARTIANVASQHPQRVGPAVEGLLKNTGDDGTVVRWATAQALAAILKAGYAEPRLHEKISELATREQDEGIRGVYQKALRAKR